jgi:TonB family protein
MKQQRSRSPLSRFAASPTSFAGLLFFAASALALSLSASALQDSTAQQQAAASAAGPSAPQPASTPVPSTPSDNQPADRPAQPSPVTYQAQPSAPQPAESRSARSASASSTTPGEITEDELRKLLVGKELFLRGGYLDNTLSFNEHGSLIGHAPQGSYALSAVEIDKVHLTRHKLELEGQRFGLHFLGALPYEDPTKAVDRVNITPKKKEVRITIDRELVVKPKQEKLKSKPAKNTPRPAPNRAAASAASDNASTETPGAPSPSQPAQPNGSSPSEGSPAPDDSINAEAQAEIAAAPSAERPVDPKSVTTTTLPAHANKVLLDAIDNVFAQGFDARMMDAMPDFWKLYYAAAAAKTDYRPQDPSVLRQNMVDQKAKLISDFEPTSNQFAQDNGVAGMSLYHVVVGADGKPGEISVARPIGFGLDESAVDAIRKASFSPAVKDGRPVPVLLDLVVEFRIYSKRTNVASAPETAGQATPTPLPGPYSAPHP